MCDRDTIQFVMFTVWMFTFVGALRSNLYDSTAFLLECGSLNQHVITDSYA